MKNIFYKGIIIQAIALFIIFSLITPGQARVIRVGPEKDKKLPSIAAKIAANGDTIEIETGVYLNDVAVWRQHNLTIRGINGRAHLKSTGANAEGKGIWVIKGDNTVVENVEFSGATVPDANGAGIRQEGKNLTVRNCFFHDNENGILTGKNLESNIVIEHTEFARNGFGDGQTHNVYIGRIQNFTLRYCYSHRAYIGHNVKSRAANNYILYNRIMDEDTGASSFAIDLPNGGRSFIIGNLIQQGPNTDNSCIISYGAEGLNHTLNELYIVNNTIVNQRGTGVFIKIIGMAGQIKIMNNIFAGEGTILMGQGEMINNLDFPGIFGRFSFFAGKPKLVDISNYDYHLTKGSPAIDAGIDPGVIGDFNLKSSWQYVHPTEKEKRIISGEIDIGAYEYSEK